MPLFNSIGGGHALPDNKVSVSQRDAATDDIPFSAALDSIGSAIGEMRDGLAGMRDSLKEAVQLSIESDRTNQALYDAVASAIYDSLDAYYADHPSRPDTKDDGRSSDGVGARLYEGRGFTRSDLLRVDRVQQAQAQPTVELKSIVNSMAQIAGRNSDPIRVQAVPVGGMPERGERKRTKDTHAGALSAQLSAQLAKNDRLIAESMSATRTAGNSARRAPDMAGLKVLAGAVSGVASGVTSGVGKVAGIAGRLLGNDASDGSERKRIRDLQINFLSNRMPAHYMKADIYMDRGMRAFQKIIDGDLSGSGVTGGMSPGPITSMITGSLGAIVTALGTLIGGGGLASLVKNAGSAILDGIGTRFPGLRKIPGVGRMFRGESDRVARKAAEEAARRAGDRAAMNAANRGGGKLTQAVARRTASNAAKRAALDAGLRQSRKGASNRTIANAARRAGRKAGRDAVKKGVARGAARMAVSGGARLAGRAALSAVPIAGTVAGLTWLGYDMAEAMVNHASEQAGDNVRQMQEANLETFTARQEGKEGGEARVAAMRRAQEADRALQSASSSFGAQVWADEKKANRALELYKQYRSGDTPMNGIKDGGIPDHGIAKKAAVDSLGFFTTRETRELAAALIEKYDADMEWKGVLDATSLRNRESIKANSPDARYAADFDGTGRNPVQYVPMGPGSMVTRPENVMNAGTGVSSTEAIGLEEQMRQTREVTTESFKDALMSPEVRDMFMSVSMNAGKSMEQQLMG